MLKALCNQGLSVLSCRGLSTLISSPTYAVLSRNQFCRELRAHGGGGSQKVTSDDEGEGGVTVPLKIDDVIYEQPLTEGKLWPLFIA